MSAPIVDRETLQALVRSVIRDVLPNLGGSPSPAGAADGATGNGSRGAAAVRPRSSPSNGSADHSTPATPVSLTTDAELAGFVQHLLALFEDPRQREALRSGRLRFRLRPAPPRPAPRRRRSSASRRARSASGPSPPPPGTAVGWCSAAAPS
jgi:hypothetical protein